MSMKLPVFEFTPDETLKWGFDRGTWVYMVYDAKRGRWDGVQYDDKSNLGELADLFCGEKESDFADIDCKADDDAWNECRKFVKKTHRLLNPFCFLEMDFDDEKDSEQECVCSASDLWAMGCPSARGKCCRSK